MIWIKDYWRLITKLYGASFKQITKSPGNMWFGSASQFFYYVAQFSFWYGIRNTAAGELFLTDKALYGFLVTLALVDTLEGIFLSGGPNVMAARVSNGTLEPVLLWPRNPLLIFSLSRPNFGQIPCAIASIVATVVYCGHYQIDIITIGIYLIAILCGISLVTAISFLHRLTVFWTRSIIQIRFSNPSYKIMVRPASSFGGSLKFVLMTVFPALLIVGLPAELIAGTRSLYWALLSIPVSRILGLPTIHVCNFVLNCVPSLSTGLVSLLESLLPGESLYLVANAFVPETLAQTLDFNNSFDFKPFELSDLLNWELGKSLPSEFRNMIVSTGEILTDRVHLASEYADVIAKYTNIRVELCEMMPPCGFRHLERDEPDFAGVRFVVIAMLLVCAD